MMPTRLWSTLVSQPVQSQRHHPNHVMMAIAPAAPSTVISAPPKAMPL